MFTFGLGVVWLSFSVGCFLAHACLSLAVHIYYDTQDTTGQSLGKINRAVITLNQNSAKGGLYLISYCAVVVFFPSTLPLCYLHQW